MNSCRRLPLKAMRVCPVVFLTMLAAASASAQTSAVAPAPGSHPSLSLAPSCRREMPANSTRINLDEGVIKEFDKAWRHSYAGTNAREAVVLIFRAEGGRYTGRSPGFTSEYRSASFKWNPAAVAIVHTHPNGSDPKPSEQDKRVADRFGVPIFTITSSGMYGYSPATKNTSKVLNGLDWLNPASLSLWAREMVRGVDTSAHKVSQPLYGQDPAAFDYEHCQ